MTFIRKLCPVAVMALVGALGSLAAPAVWATPISPGQSIAAAGENEPFGGILVDSLVVNFSNVRYSGSLSSYVYSGDSTNPHGGYTFVYKIDNDALSEDELHRFTISSFFGFLTDVSYGTPTTDVRPTAVDRNASGSIGFSYFSTTGFPVGFGYIEPGSSSALMIIQTDANNYQTTDASVINGLTEIVPSFAPLMSEITPEPGSIVLAICGGLGVAGAAWTRRKRAL